MNLKDALVEAKNLILTHGWTQGDLGSESEGYCLHGALDAATFENDPEDDLYIEAHRQVVATLKNRGSVALVSTWNDAPHRTKQDVLDLLDSAASNL